MTMRIVALGERVMDGTKAQIRFGESDFAAIVDSRGSCEPALGEFMVEMSYEQVVTAESIDPFDDWTSGLWQHADDSVRIRGRISALHDGENGETLADLYVMNGPEFLLLRDLGSINKVVKEGQGLEVVVKGLRVYLVRAS